MHSERPLSKLQSLYHFNNSATIPSWASLNSICWVRQTKSGHHSQFIDEIYLGLQETLHGNENMPFFDIQWMEESCFYLSFLWHVSDLTYPVKLPSTIFVKAFLTMIAVASFAGSLSSQSWPLMWQNKCFGALAQSGCSEWISRSYVSLISTE